MRHLRVLVAAGVAAVLCLVAVRGASAQGHLGPMGMAATKIGSTVALELALHALAKRHPTAAKVLGYGDGLGMGAIAAHNAMVGR